MFEIQEIPKTFSPSALAIIDSGTVDIPTASAPHFLNACISAGVSKVRPESAR